MDEINRILIFFCCDSGLAQNFRKATKWMYKIYEQCHNIEETISVSQLSTATYFLANSILALPQILSQCIGVAWSQTWFHCHTHVTFTQCRGLTFSVTLLLTVAQYQSQRRSLTNSAVIKAVLQCRRQHKNHTYTVAYNIKWHVKCRRKLKIEKKVSHTT